MQREYESRIRQLKKQERLARKQGYKDVANKLNERWKSLDRKYKHFSLKNVRAFYSWRTQVMRNEEMQRNKLGNEEFSKISKEIKQENIIKYQVIVKSSNQKMDVDRRILDQLDANKVYKDFKGNELKIRNFDRAGNTGIEHIAQAKHHLKEEDIKFIDKALEKPFDYIETNLKGNIYVIKGKFGINNDMDYLIVCAGNRKKTANTITTVYATNKDNYKNLKKHKK